MYPRIPHALTGSDHTDQTWPSYPDLGKVAPYGIYDIAANAGWVSVGIDHDTAAFAVNAIRPWHEAISRDRYNCADRLLITADGGGSNRSRARLTRRRRSWPQCRAVAAG